MKGDPAGKVRCPAPTKKGTRCKVWIAGWRGASGRRGNGTMRQALRKALMGHFDVYHPELDVRERSVLADIALQSARLA